MVHDTTTIVDKHPHGIFLMRSQLHAHQSGDAQVRAVELAKHGAVELVIVQAHQGFFAFGVLTKPVLKGCT